MVVERMMMMMTWERKMLFRVLMLILPDLLEEVEVLTCYALKLLVRCNNNRIIRR